MAIEREYTLDFACMGYTGLKLILARKYDSKDYTMAGPMHDYVTLVAWRTPEANDNVAQWVDGKLAFYYAEDGARITDEAEARTDYYYRRFSAIARAHGFLPPLPFRTAGEARGEKIADKTKFNVTLDAADAARLKRAALDSNTAVAEIIRVLTSEWLDSNGK